MRNALLFFVASAAIAAAAACSSSSDDTSSPPPGPGDASGTDQQAPPQDDSGTTTDSAPSDAGSGNVTFKYTPGWKGVTSVAVVGGFGQSTDWTSPLVTLTDDGSGNFTGSANVPPGQYLYVFQVTGDDDATKSAQFVRYAIDPANSSFADCPATSPTYSKNEPNPCSQLTVPQGSAAPTFHIKGTVTLSGANAKDYLVEVERQEPKSHHFFANRTTTGNDGKFDLEVAAGSWRLQVLHPTYLKQSDEDRDPLTNNALRRAISGAFTISADINVPPVEVKYDGYAAMQPQAEAGALPTTFSFTILSDATDARLTIYGPGKSIGDPWYASKSGSATSVSFDGKFNTDKPPPDAGTVVPGTRYFWGTEQDLTHEDGGVTWTGQSMVFPVTWQ